MQGLAVVFLMQMRKLSPALVLLLQQEAIIIFIMSQKKECPLLAGKTAEESLSICTQCAVRPCVFDKGEKYKCHHCGGNLFYDEVDNEWRCLSCARSPIAPVAVKIAPNIEKRLAPAPERTPLKRTVPYRTSDVLHTNGTWYPIGQITFRPEHMIFLIKSLPLLQEGHYPRNPIGTGYTDSKILIKRGRHTAYFEHPVQLAAEVETRLEQCGPDGLLLEALYAWGKRTKYLMNAFRCNEYQLRKRIKSALWYISGWERKQIPYREFWTKRKYERSKPQQPEPQEPAPSGIGSLLGKLRGLI